MHFYKKISLFSVFLFLYTHALALPNNIEIRAVALNLIGETYKLDVFSEITLDEKIEEAVNNGVVLNFLYEFQLVQPRKYWFDYEIITQFKRVTVRYHALSRQYLVNNADRQTSHDILSEAMIALMQIEAWEIIDKEALKQDINYKATVLIRLDKSKLPKALQVDAINSEDWSLASQRVEWQPKFQDK